MHWQHFREEKETTRIVLPYKWAIIIITPARYAGYGNLRGGITMAWLIGYPREKNVRA